MQFHFCWVWQRKVDNKLGFKSWFASLFNQLYPAGQWPRLQSLTMKINWDKQPYMHILNSFSLWRRNSSLNRNFTISFIIASQLTFVCFSFLVKQRFILHTYQQLFNERANWKQISTVSSHFFWIMKIDIQKDIGE